jgi:CBS domain-containing membrane protein
LKASDVMRPPTDSLPQNAGLSQVVELLMRRRVDFLPILDAAQHVVGVITPSDLLDYLFPRFYELLRDYNALEDKGQLSSLFGAAFSGLDIADNKLILAADIMRTNLIWITGEDTLLNAASHLFGQQVKQLPVVDRDRRLLGMLSETDVILSFLKGTPAPTARK